MTKLTLKDFFMLLGYVIAGGTFIYSMGVKKANKDSNLTKIETSIADLNTNYSDLKKSVDIANGTLVQYGLIMEEVTGKQDKLTNSVKSLALKVADTPLEFARIMGTVQFEVVQDEVMKSVFPETKVKIIKMDTTK